ncbi:glutathione transferase GstA [Myxococcus llanfairpwllgwyngyllgogerychwyrndrobwllllantysiliogogogochensis]|uniref:Glutathione transferase GstA n=1 Tax=Myxococcus llanfairpwllgwyngyllgogerychwyrndrobwllllantysiliogogogochensis TaxID=2590453 RepID=A0A540WR86_9BACT|nr:glutathione transferase GstA [Myxococcus llanfairpwllgwyngyllgogerychwyrndrobwllllantysiliogogogochensis]TQF11508.1 glutathione transferase GstA [Myxococcus llanfairpwllgwyngyllgogerychwyrndrobwllllantysiliogogogochensis]
MKLYYSSGACSLSPHIALREAGLKFDLEKVDLRGKKTETGADYFAVNTKGYVPALQLDNGTVLTEGPAIVQYIADQAPEAKLAPANGSLERYKLQELLNFISTEIHKGFSPLFNPAFPDEGKKIYKDRLAVRFKTLDEVLSKNTFLMGEQFTVADAYLFTVLNWAKPVQVDLEAFPAVKAYHARIAERPHVQAALAAEGLKK